MTDRHSGYIVVLENNFRDDDAEAILNALRMVKGVLSVEPIVADPHAYIARERVKKELSEKLWNALEGDDKAER